MLEQSEESLPVDSRRHQSTMEDPNPRDVLSNKQMAILLKVCRDVRRKEIAAELGVGHQVVSDYIGIIKKKLHVEGTAGMVKAAIRHGLISPRLEVR